MSRQRYSWVVIIFIALILLTGCRGNPNARQQMYLKSARRFSAESKYREAAIQYLNALKVDNRYPDAHYELAKTYGHLGRFDSERVELSRTVDLQPANYQARIDLGNLLFAAGKISEAQAQANAMLAAQPNNPDLHALLSAIASRRGESDKALSELQRAVELDPNRAAFHEQLALLQDGDQVNAASVENEMKRAVALDPKSLNDRLFLAAFYSRNNRLQDAERVGWEAVATDPRSLAAREVVTRVILNEGDPARAELVLRQASIDFAGDPQGVCVLADYFFKSGQLDKARAEYTSLVAKYPKNTSVQKGYVRLLLEVKDFTAARAMLAELTKTNPKDPEVAALNGNMILRDGNSVGAVNSLQQSARAFPTDASIQYWLGKAALEQGDRILAENSFRRAAELNPSDLDTQREQARIACERGDTGLMAEVAGQMIATAPGLADGYVLRANAERIRSLAAPAEADLTTAMNLAPEDPQPYLLLGEIRFAQKRFPEGVSLLERALRYNPDSVAALQLLVDYDLYQKQPEKALARLKLQIAKSPMNSRFYDLLAKLQIQSKHLDQAAATVARSIQLNPADGQAVLLFAQIASLRGKTVDAVDTWQKWSNAHPNDADAFAILGTLEESRGDLVKAETCYRKALQIQPAQPVAANNLAYRMLLTGEAVDSALTLAQTARQGMPDSPTAADTLAWAFYFKGSYEFARNLLEDAISSDPNNATMQYHLGMVYSRLSDKNSASVHLKKAAALAPDSPIGNDAKTALHTLG